MTPSTNVSPLDAISLRVRWDLPQRWIGRRAIPVVCALSFLVSDALAIAISALLVSGAWQIMLLRDLATYDDAACATIIAISACAILYLASKGRYGGRIPFWSELRIILSISWLAAGLLAVVSVARPSACGLASAALLLFPLLAAIGSQTVKYALARSGLWVMNILIVGEGPELAALDTALRSTPSLGYCVVCRVDPATFLAEPVGARLRPAMERYGANRVIVALGSDHPLRRQVIDSSLSERVSFLLTPKISSLDDVSSEAASFLSHDAVLMLVRDERSRLLSRAFKVAMDVTLAGLLLIAFSPIFLAVAVLNAFDDGPVFFAHRRVGIGGRSFPCLKFRTMHVDGDRVLAQALANDPELEREWTTQRKLRVDPRVTRVGRFLRKTSLDELPQLINVLRLQMSLVGPRPIVESEMALFGADIVHYFSARPGLTGLWQVSGRSNTSYARRVKLDVWYVNHWTIWNDLAVLLKTVPAVLARHGAH